MTEVSKRAVVVLVLDFPLKPRPVHRCTGKSSCWVLFWNPGDAVLFACRSSAAQVQGQSPNGGFSSCFAADSDGGRGHLPGRMVSAAGPVMVIQQPMNSVSLLQLP